MDPLLETLDLFDRKLGIDRAPFESEILITLDLLDRAHSAKESDKQKPDNPPKVKARGDRR